MESSDPRPSDLDLVSRFACLGSEEGHISVKQPEEFNGMVPSLGTFLCKEKGSNVIKRLKYIFQSRRYISKDPLLFAIAHIIRNIPVTESHDEDKIRSEAYSLAQDVCETSFDLFTFVHFDKKATPPNKAGFGHGMRKFVTKWYMSRPPMKLAYEGTRFKSARRWTHRDLIRLCHINVDKKSKATSVVLNYLQHKSKYKLPHDIGNDDSETGEIVQFFTDLNSLNSTQPPSGTLARSLIEKHKLVDRQIPTFLMNTPETFEGLLGNMTLEDVFRKIPKFASLGMLEQGSMQTPFIVEIIKNLESVKTSKIHPIVIFLALRRYESDRSKKWTKNYHVVRALQAAFTASLESLPIIGKRTLVAIHVDGKASKQHVLGANYLSPIMPCALMTKFLLQSSLISKYHKEINLNCTAAMPRIIEAFINFTKDPANINYDIVEPIKWATQNKKSFDNILIMSDKKIVQSQEDFQDAVRQYRSEISVPNTKIVIVGLSENVTGIQKLDFNMCEISGFNEKIPPVIYNFFLGHYHVTSDIADAGQP
ncbi:hypothetical protein Btru_077902 [Bulinus truncatus]|nr:hypothetical protein Btru_077902 [Bulinus truncatus]